MVWILQLASTSAEPQVPCYFIFGDSLVDNGNNNNLFTEAKVNYPPYGVDFPGGVATGRFSNGLNTADILGKLLGFANYTPPHATAQGRDIVKGLNYGSGGAGILSESGRHLGQNIGLDRQLFNHRLTVFKIIGLQGNNSTFTKNYLSKCIYTVGMGNNDYINNYFMPDKYNSSNKYTPEQFADVLIQQYSKQLNTLYTYGARKVAVFGLGLSGCTPAKIAIFGANASGCVDKINDAIALFNERLKPMVDDLNKNLTDSKYIYINTTNISLGDPSSAGFTVVSSPCCTASIYFGKGQCEPGQGPCSDRGKYVFWDEFHPTEKVNMGTASRSYMAASKLDSYPMDIRSLALLTIQPPQ
ncbi:GDSL-like Lipase/Acylhydrolase superfamily protein [Heracleum sosnowskyi]|uniref:GDSL-like Lipase/Acylhydrolase superfamily protein n=1 Tax=Heracleum sosnowskyi TaxID=360622 RepID=A0AAD8MMJ2_9APIA|nr:GDSL-like Lipase/Acylhydrolase superfamily protein [Heracleum sosnowskyi]